MPRSVVTATLVALVLVASLVFWLTRDDDAVRARPRNGTTPVVDSGKDPAPLPDANLLNVEDGPGNGEDSSSPLRPRSDDEEQEPEFVIEGRVLDDEGRPLRRTQIVVYPFRRTLFTQQAMQLLEKLRDEDDPVVTVNTDGSGYFQAPVPAVGEYLVEARSRHRATAIEAPLRITPHEPRIFIFFTLGPGAEISGTLRDARGLPLSGESLFLLEKLEGGARAYHTHRTRSGIGGFFEFPGLEPRRYVLMVLPEDSPGRLMTQVMAPSSDLDVQLESEQQLLGRVSDAVTGDPVAGAQVTAVNRTTYDQVTTQDDGTFELRLAGNDVDVLIHHSDFIMKLVRKMSLASAEDPVAFELERGVTLEGRLIDDTGRGAPGVTVGVQQQGWLFDDIRATRTSSEGVFSLGPVDQDKAVTVLARLPGWTLPIPGAIPVRAGGDLQLIPTRAIVGVVTDSHGKPVPDVWVRLVAGGDASQIRALQWLRDDQESWTDELGNFVIEDVVPAAGYTLLVRHPDMANRRIVLPRFPDEPLSITVDAGGALEGRLILPAAAGGDGPDPRAVFSSIILLLETEAAPPVTRRSSGRLEGGRRLMPRDDGSFTTDQLPSGTLTIYIQAPGFLEQSTQVEIINGQLAQLDIPLRRGHAVRVKVADAAGNPVSGTAVQLSGQTLRLGTTPFAFPNRVGRTDSRGEFIFTRVQAGRYMASARGRRGWVRQAVQVGASPEDQVIEVLVKIP